MSEHFTLTVPAYISTAVPAIKRFEREKKGQYGQRVQEDELGSFTPIVFFHYGRWELKLRPSVDGWLDKLSYPSRRACRFT